MTTIHVVGSTDDFRTLLETAYKDGSPVDIVPIETDGFDPEIVRALCAAEPDLIAVGPALSVDDSVKVIEGVSEAAPHLPTVLVANAYAALWQRVMRAGARDIVAPIAAPTAIREACDHVIEIGRKLRPTGPADAASAAAAPPPPPPRGRTVAIVSPKGGSGKTTVAANLAATVARSRPGEVVVADLDVQFGDIGHAYRLDPEYSLLNAVSPGVTPTMLKGFLTPHSSKVLALTAPNRPEDADDIDAAAAAGAVRSLSELFGVVIVDTGAGLDDTTLAAIETASDVVFVTATDVPSVRAVVKEHDILGRLGLLDNRSTHLVLNRADARVGLSISDIEQTIGLDASMTIPSTRSIPAALNLGEPAVISDARSQVARAFNEFAETLQLVSPSASSRAWRKR